MKEHIEALITEIDNRMMHLGALKHDLLVVFGELPPATVEVVPTTVKKPVTEKPITARKVPVNPTAMSLQDTAVKVAKVAEPFGVAEIHAVLGKSRKSAENFITRGKAKGWIKSVSFGKYMRTSKHPGATPVPVAVADAPLPGTEPALSDSAKIARLTKERDEASAAGKTDVASFLQFRIDKLTSP